METQTIAENIAQVPKKKSSMGSIFYVLSGLILVYVGFLYFYSKSIDTFMLGALIVGVICFVIGYGIHLQERWVKVLIALLGIGMIIGGVLLLLSLGKLEEAMIIMAPVFFLTGALPLLLAGILTIAFAWRLKFEKK